MSDDIKNELEEIWKYGQVSFYARVYVTEKLTQIKIVENEHKILI